jgi:hypothetical protein
MKLTVFVCMWAHGLSAWGVVIFYMNTCYETLSSMPST